MNPELSIPKIRPNVTFSVETIENEARKLNKVRKYSQLPSGRNRLPGAASLFRMSIFVKLIRGPLTIGRTERWKNYDN